MAIKITINVDDTDEKVLLNDIADIDAWAQEAITGKVNNCWKRMKNDWTTKLMDDESFTDPIPSNKAEFVTLVTARADYQNRSKRDEANAVDLN